VTTGARAGGLLVFAAVVGLFACERSRTAAPADAGPSGAPSGSSGPRPPALLYLPDGGDTVLAEPGEVRPQVHAGGSGRCPAEMVDVRGRFCIDRYEASLVDLALGRAISPYFAPSRGDALQALAAFEDGEPPGAPPLPLIPDWERIEVFTPRAESNPGVVPNGYVSGLLATKACEAAAKRLCTLSEWQEACRGERQQKFPYGDRYQAGACNVGREAHPASVLYGNPSIHHLDPRLNLVQGSEGPLLRRTGESSRCRSEWNGDAVLDMVGNLDEWIDDPSGMFAGGFYARATVDGCDSRITQHPNEYYDYSTGVRCCSSP